MTFLDWHRRLLAALDITPTPARLAFLIAWAACEGGTAKNNPLNTTQLVPGATVYNRAGVRNYPDDIAGLAATLLTLRLPYYDGIRAALRADGLTALEIAHRSALGLATWGTGSRCVLRRLAAS